MLNWNDTQCHVSIISSRVSRLWPHWPNSTHESHQQHYNQRPCDRERQPRMRGGSRPFWAADTAQNLQQTGQWLHQEFSFGGYSPGGLKDRSLPIGSARASPGRMYGDKVPGIWSGLQTLFTDFDCRNYDQNLKISHNLLPDSWPECITVGVKWHFRAKHSSPRRAPPLKPGRPMEAVWMVIPEFFTYDVYSSLGQNTI